MFKKLLFLCSEIFDSLLDQLSVRLCYGCKKASAVDNGFLCDVCYSKLELDYTKSIKQFSSKDLLDLDSEFLLSYPKIYFAAEYGILTKSLMRTYKYRKPHYVRFWQELLFSYWSKYSSVILSENASERAVPISTTPVKLIVTAVPMHWGKMHRRAFNQSALLANKFSLALQQELKQRPIQYLLQSDQGLNLHLVEDIAFVENLFIRNKETESLFKKDRLERQQILAGAFDYNQIDKYLDSSYKYILVIVDDITTTGSTFIEMLKVLNRQGCGIWTDVVCLAATGRNF